MNNALHCIWSLVTKEFLQLSRNKLLFGFVLLGPLLEVMLMGGMAGGGVQNRAHTNLGEALSDCSTQASVSRSLA